MKPLILLISLLGWHGLTAAQSSAVVSEQDYLSEMPIVLSVSRLPQRLDDTPGAVTIIDRDMIRLSGARDVADLLRLVPGFQTSTSFETGAPLAYYHGAFDAYSNRLQLLIDGRSAYSPYAIGSVGPGMQTVELDDIERIEVLRGSNSAAYGARAVLGVINIVTQHTADTLGLRAGVSVGQNGVRDAKASIGWGSVLGGTYRLSVDRRADDGLAGSNGHNQVSRFNLRSDLPLTSRDELQLRAGTVAIDAGKGYPGTVDNPFHEAGLRASYAQVDWRRNLGVDADLALTVSHTQDRYDDGYKYSLRRLGINDSIDVSINGRSRNDAISLLHTQRYSPALRWVWGAEVRREQVVSKPLYNTEAALVTQFTRLFGNAEWRFGSDWVLNAGAMAERNSVTGGSLAPRLMLNWHAADGHTLRGGISRAFRPPSAYENFADVRYIWNGRLLAVTTLASGNLASESMVVRELGYLGDFPSVGLNLDVRVFDERLDNFITQLNATSPKDYGNTENIAIRGLEYQVNWRPWRGTRVMFNQAYVEIDSPQPGRALAAPKWSSSLALFQKLPGGLDLTLTHYDGGIATLPGSHPNVYMNRTDLRLGSVYRVAGKKAEVALVLQNMGRAYADFAPEFSFERRAFVTLQLEN